jgi:hypothetical protein
VRHVRHVTVGAADGAADVRVQREPAHAGAIQDGLRPDVADLDRVLGLSSVTHTRIIGVPAIASNEPASAFVL